MRFLKYAVLLGICMVVAGTAHAQVRVGIGFGPGYVAPAYVGPAPVCAYGYYGYAPYACAPYGYYGPDYFAGGVFIGAGPWFHGFYGGRGFYGRGPGFYGRGPAFYGRGGYGFNGGFRGGAPVRGGGGFHSFAPARGGGRVPRWRRIPWRRPQVVAAASSSLNRTAGSQFCQPFFFYP